MDIERPPDQAERSVRWAVDNKRPRSYWSIKRPRAVRGAVHAVLCFVEVDRAVGLYFLYVVVILESFDHLSEIGDL